MIMKQHALMFLVLLTGFSPVFGQTHFQFTSNTGNNATVAIPTSSNPSVNGVPLQAGDEIGAFTPDGLCVGAVVWGGVNSALTVWGDDDQTAGIDGMRSGETISYRVWKQSISVEYQSVVVTYGLGNGMYSPNGLYTLSSLNANAPPNPPDLIAPIDGATGIPVAPRFEWNASPYADRYHLQVAEDVAFTAMVLDTIGLVSTSFDDAGLSYSTTYYWRVSSSNPGGEGSFSTARSFTTVESPPAAPILLSPGDASVNQPLTLTLSWNSVPGATSYAFELSTTASFDQIVAAENGLTGFSKDINALTSGTTYYWRVNANGSGGTGPWSSTWSFMTVPGAPAAPALTAPPNNAVDQPLSVTLEWDESNSADWYHVQLSTDAGFANTVAEDSITGTSLQVQSLQVGTKYYWRVQAGNEGGLSEWSVVRNFTTIPPAPSTPSHVSPADGSVNQPKTLTLNWSGPASADDYALQVSSDPSFATTTVDASALSSTTMEVGPLASGVTYHWRVNARNAGGTSDWSQPWSFTTVPNPPDPPVLSSPADGAENQSTTLTMSWGAVSGATQYRLQVSASPTFASMAVDTANIVGTTIDVGPLATATLYYWRVLAANEGGPGDWSVIRSFTTMPSPPPAPVLAAPPDKAVDQPTTLLLSWNPASGASSYHLQVSTNQTFTTTVVNDLSVSGTSRQVGSLTNSTAYYWRVRAQNAGGTSNWSPVWQFTTSSGLPPPPTTPTLSSPSNGAVNRSLPLTLSWNASSGATSYRLQVSADSDFSPAVVDQSGLSSTSHVVNALAYSTTYYWRVLAQNEGGVSSWSTPWSFTTASPPPGSPILISPVDNAGDIPVTATFQWAGVSAANSYHIQLSTKSDFKTVQYENSTLTDTLVQVGGLQYDETYYWRVRAANDEGPGSWSSMFAFSTVRQAPAAPQLAGPADGSQTEPTNPTLSWFSSLRATSYRIQVSQTASFNGSVFVDRTQADTLTQVSALASSTIYYWRVSAANEGGSSPWTPVWSFKTIDPPLSSPILTSPGQDASNQPTTLELQWNSVPGAATYHAQISQAGSFASPVIDSADIMDTRLLITGLDYGEQYYWRVRGFGTAGPGQWSSISRFSTAQEDPLAPELSSPPNGATGLSTSPTLTWNSVFGATGYDVQVSAAADFSAIASGANNLSGTSYQATGLSEGTTYYWRARSRSITGASAWSAVWSFSTVTPIPVTPVLVLPADNTVDLVVTPRLSWNAADRASSYRVEVSRTASFASPIMDTSVTETTVTAGGLAYSTTYYWRVRGINSTGSSQPSAVRSFVTHDPSVRTEHTFVLGYPSAATAQPQDYRLVGLPGPTPTTISSLSPESNGTGWRAYRDNGLPTDYLIESGLNQQLTFGDGRAYWLIHNGPLSYSGSIPSIPVNSANEAEIPLQVGWNIITNPFSSPVAWSTVQSVNGTVVPLWHFENGFEQEDSLRPFCGYYLDNPSGLGVLRIPKPQPQNLAAKAAVRKTVDQTAWTVSMTLTSGTAVDKAARFGVNPEASLGRDRWDVRRPRATADIPSIIFHRPEWDTGSGFFASDIRPRADTLQIWEFLVIAPGKSGCKIVVEGIESVPGNLAVVLFDESRKRVVDLRHSTQYDFLPVSEQSSLRVVVGIPADVHQWLPELHIPAEIVLGQNYPNPFNPSTVIPLSLPAPSHVTLTIYNTLGQEVMVLHDGLLDRGYHTFYWNGRDSNGDVVSTGLYFSRLSVEGNSHIRKMMLVK